LKRRLPDLSHTQLPKMPKTSIKLNLALGCLAACNVFLAILPYWYLITRLGVGVETDAFFASGALPQLTFLIISGSLTHVLVPLLATEAEEAFRQDAWDFFSAVIILFSFIALLLLLIINIWVPFLVSGFSPAGKTLTVSLTRIQLINMVLNAGIVVLWSIYYARQRYTWAEFSPLFANVAGFLFLLWALPRVGIGAAVWAMVLNNSLKLAFLLPILGRWRRPSWNSPVKKEAWRRLKPFLFSQVQRADPLVDRFLTSMTMAGSLSLLYVGQQIYGAVNLIINKAISSPMAPRLAIKAKEKVWENYQHIYRRQLLLTVSLMGLGALMLFAVGEPVLQLTIGRGGITAENIHLLWLIMIALIGMLASGTVGQISSVAFYAMGDTKTPTRLAIISYIIYVPLKIIIFLRYGLIGLAITTSMYCIISSLLQFLIVERNIQTGYKSPSKPTSGRSADDTRVTASSP
jgi:putative peptidoglycan lipid II flippase